MKKLFIGFTACGLMLLVLGAAATRNRYVGTFVGDGTGVTNTVSVSGVATVAIYVTTATITNKVYGSNLVGVLSGTGATLVTNTVAQWPATPDAGGAAYFANSNGTVYLLTSLPFTKTWAATNKLAP
jgi:hypothetical protein